MPNDTNYTDEQIRRINYLLTDQWVTEDDSQTQQNLDRVLGQIESPLELHQFAGNFNWDCGHTELEKVIRHPLCDKGTALMIYFLGRPEWFYNHLQKGRAMIGEQPLLFAFLKEIEGMVERGEFRSSRIKFNPTELKGKTNSLNREGANLVPAFMKHPIDGEDVKIVNMW